MSDVFWQPWLGRGQHTLEPPLDGDARRFAGRSGMNDDPFNQLPHKFSRLRVVLRSGQPLLQAGQGSAPRLPKVWHEPHRRGLALLDGLRQLVSLLFRGCQLFLHARPAKAFGQRVDEVRQLALHGRRVAPQLRRLLARLIRHAVAFGGEGFGCASVSGEQPSPTRKLSQRA